MLESKKVLNNNDNGNMQSTGTNLKNLLLAKAGTIWVKKMSKDILGCNSKNKITIHESVLIKIKVE